LPVLVGHRWPYTTGHTSRPTGGQCLADVSAPWPRTVPPRTTPGTWPPDCHTVGSLRPVAPVTQSLPRCPWPQLLFVTSCVAVPPWLDRGCWPPVCYPVGSLQSGASLIQYLRGCPWQLLLFVTSCVAVRLP